MVAINSITAAPFADSKAVCSAWLGYVSIIESKDNYSVWFLLQKSYILYYILYIHYIFRLKLIRILIK